MAIQLLLALAVTEMLMAVDCIYYARVSPTALLTEEEFTQGKVTVLTSPARVKRQVKA